MTSASDQRLIDRNIRVHDRAGAGYRTDVYARYRSRCTDMRVAAWRKRR